MSQFSTSHSSASPMLQQRYVHNTQSTPLHEWNENGKFSKEYLTLNPPHGGKSLQEIFEDPNYMKPTAETAAFADLLRIDWNFVKENIKRKDELKLFHLVAQTTTSLDMYIHYLDFILHQQVTLETCWKHYQAVPAEKQQIAISEMAILKQNCDKAARQFALLEKKIKGSYATLDRLKTELKRHADSNRTLADEIVDELPVSKFREKKLAIAQQQESLIASLDKILAST